MGMHTMRAALLIVLGLVIGIIGTALSMNALGQRDPLPRAVMSVMAYHMGQLQQAIKTRHCDAPQSDRQLDRLQSAAADIDAAFAGVGQPFADAARRLQERMRQASQAPHADCATLAAAIRPVGDACDACHQKYR
jgi:cytochrome c556